MEDNTSRTGSHHLDLGSPDPVRGPRRRAEVGENVHYVDLSTGSCRAALVTETGHGGTAGLVVFNPGGASFHQLGEGGVQVGWKPGHYHLLADHGHR